MSVERKTSVKISSGFHTHFVGLFRRHHSRDRIENARLSSAEQITLKEKVSLRSPAAADNYIGSEVTDCKTLNTILENNINELGKKVGTIIEYEKKSLFNEEEFDLQLQDYFLTEIQFYFLAQEINKKMPPRPSKDIILL